jgi:RNA polymerase sigma-70 factor (ECF subfamily)
MSVPALADLYEQHGQRLYRYALMILADAAAAEDAVQDAFCQLAVVLQRRPDVATLPYLTTIVRNGCYGRLRRRRRSPVLEAEPLLEAASADAHEDERLLLEQALRRLPPEQREVVHLKVYEGLTFEEIGERCGVSLNTAASRYRYALDAMRRMLDVERKRA